MDAVKFLEIIDRLSRKGNNIEKMRYNEYREANDNAGAVRFVERWSKEHPRKTRQSVFLEQYPETQIDDNGVLGVCPAPIFHSHRTDGGRCIDINRKCTDCRREFWMQEVD